MINNDILQYLKDNLYIVQQGDTLVISNKFTRELGISSTNTKSVAPVIITKKIIAATKETYKLFIDEAKVPSKIDTTNGSYWANRYSESGYKAFAKVFNDPLISRPVLLAATKWYYAQTRTARKMIGTYFSEGIWESCYDDFIKAREKSIKLATEPMNQADFIHTPKIKDENESNTEYR